MSDLWQSKRDDAMRRVQPLAVRMRPRTLDEFRGQKHILGEGKLLRRMLEADVMTSLILHGPPGTGKTTLAELISLHTKRHFERENAASVGVKRIREVVDDSVRRLQSTGKRTILFLDEIHRFTKAQQDVLLGDVERGVITLIGATTENPLFACNSALVSRSTLFRLEPLSVDDVTEAVRSAVSDPVRGFGEMRIEVTDEALRVWAIKSDGDARRALTALEVAVLSSQSRAAVRGGRSEGGEDVVGVDRVSAGRLDGPGNHGTEGSLSQAKGPLIVIGRQEAEDSMQQKAAVYDQAGDERYDAISAMIKSVRGSDPDAAVYWVARMLEGAEDPRYIARRLAVLASEDIGNADPRAVMVAIACWELVERIGMPEARITLAQCATYLALAPKSNAVIMAIDDAMTDVREGRTLPVPVYLRDKNSSPISDDAGAGLRLRERDGEKYVYTHDAPGGVSGQDYLGVDKRYYVPTHNGAEKQMAERLDQIRALRARDKGVR